MAMNKKDKPLRPSGPTKPISSDIYKKPKPIIKVKPKGAITKPAVKNPSAPKPVGSGAKSSVKVMTKTESMLKKGQGKSSNTAGKPAPKKYKKVGEIDKMIENMQSFRGRTPRGGAGGMGGGGLFNGRGLGQTR